MYRVNYGNGQVSNDYPTKVAAQRHIDEMDMYREFARIQCWDSDAGAWFSVRRGRVEGVGRRARFIQESAS